MQNSKHVLRGSEHYYRDILLRFKQPRTAFSVAKLDGNSSGSQGVPRQKDAKPLLTSMFYSVQSRLTKSKNYLWKLHFYPGNGSASPTRRYEVYKTILQALSWTPKKAKHQFLFNSGTACKLPWGFWHHSMSVIPSIYFCIGLIAVILNITMFGGSFRHLHHLGHLPPHLSKPAQVHGFDLDHPAISRCPAAHTSAPSGRIVASGIMSLTVTCSLHRQIEKYISNCFLSSLSLFLWQHHQQSHQGVSSQISLGPDILTWSTSSFFEFAWPCITYY